MAGSGVISVWAICLLPPAPMERPASLGLAATSSSGHMRGATEFLKTDDPIHLTHVWLQQFL